LTEIERNGAVVRLRGGDAEALHDP
jgi:hypothetical protein